MSSQSDDAVAKRAYYLWENAGRPEGCAIEHWLAAEARMRADGSGAQGGSSRPAEVQAQPEAARGGRAMRYGLVLQA
jgi:hypothetical protein